MDVDCQVYLRDNFEEIEQNYATDRKQQELSDLYFLSRCMKDGIVIRDRKHLLRHVAKCFTGEEAIDWMLNHSKFTNCKTRKEGEVLGEKLREIGLFSSTPTSHSFQDKGNLFYRFKEDEPESKLLNEMILWPNPSKHRPPDVSAILLEKGIILYMYLYQRTNYFTTGECNISSKIEEFEKATSELQQIDTQDELTHEEALSFWLNVYHLMQIHFAIRTKGSQASKSGSDNTYLYNIAGEYLTMSNIENYFLRDPKGKSKSKKKDYKFSYALRKNVVEISFILNYGLSICPPIAIYYPSSVHRQIQSVASHYLEDNIRVDADTKTIQVTGIVYQNYKDFGTTKAEGIVTLCTNYLPQKTAKLIVTKLTDSDENYKIKCRKEDAYPHISINDRVLASITKRKKETK